LYSFPYSKLSSLLVNKMSAEQLSDIFDTLTPTQESVTGQTPAGHEIAGAKR